MASPAENEAVVREARIAVNKLANNAHNCTTPDLTPAEATDLESRVYAALDLFAALRAQAEAGEQLRKERDEAIRDIRAVHKHGQEIAASAVRNALAKHDRKLKAAVAERDAAIRERDDLLRQRTDLEDGLGHNVVTIDKLVEEKTEGWRRALAAERERDQAREALREAEVGFGDISVMLEAENAGFLERAYRRACDEWVRARAALTGEDES